MHGTQGMLCWYRPVIQSVILISNKVLRVLCKIISFRAAKHDWCHLVEGKTLVNLSKSDFTGSEDARQTFSKFQSNQQNCNKH